MRIAHVSDSHGAPSLVRAACASEADVVVITGDCLSNRGRVPLSSLYGGLYGMDGIVPALEREYQRKWLRRYAKKWAQELVRRHTPIIVVAGNHDFIPYAGWLEHYGADVHEITDQRPCIDLLGVRWAGFRQVPPITGEWVGEHADLTPYVERVRACNPDVLLTHAPPLGILDQEGYGSPELRAWLLSDSHRVRAHFFGHAHAGYGSRMEGGVAFYNGAGHCTIHDVDVF